MKVECIKLIGERKMIWETRDLTPGEGEVLVKTHQASICDADLRAWQGQHMPEDLPRFDYIGHEGGGTVVAVGAGVRELREGDRVMLFGPHNSFASHFTAPVENLHKIPDGMAFELGCLGEPVYVGAYAAYEADPPLGSTVAVVGLNFQGLLAAQIFKRRGVGKLIAIDYSDKHLEIARQFGADVLINTTRADAWEKVRELTGGRLCAVVFHSCGYWNPRFQEYFNLARELTGDEGLLASVPDMMSPFTDFSFHRIHHHALRILLPAGMHHSAAFRSIWVPRVMDMVMGAGLDIDPLITGSYKISEAIRAMEDFDADEHHVKVRLVV